MGKIFLITDDGDVDQYIATHPEYLECRGDGHTWQRLHVGYLVQGRGTSTVYARQALCPACGMKRTKRRDVDGNRLATVYDYPDDYQVKGGRISRDTVELYTISQVKRRRKS